MTRVTPRATRLVRVADLQAFREAIAALACDGAPLDARDRFVLLPTRAAAAQLIRTIEARLPVPCGALLLPDLTTARELVGLLGTRLPFDRPMLTDAEREVLLGVACRTAREAGCDPPFRLRPALVSEMLRTCESKSPGSRSLLLPTGASWMKPAVWLRSIRTVIFRSGCASNALRTVNLGK